MLNKQWESGEERKKEEKKENTPITILNIKKLEKPNIAEAEMGEEQRTVRAY